MPAIKNKITPCLWFDTQAEDAIKLYVSVFPNSRINAISRYSKAGREIHGKEPGSVLTVEFVLDGDTFTALNGGPRFKFSEAVSFQIMCDTQDEIDHYWNGLIAPSQQGQCGWLKDKFGLSWQVVPSILPSLITDPDSAKVERVMAALMKMKKFDIDGLTRAHAG